MADPKDPMERITCDGCGRSFPTVDAHDMLAAIKGSCPDCGGPFQLDGYDQRAPTAEAAA
ncbi:MAG: hypothetical protein H0T69_13305 [Thermoleophilaceae bacterium]|nr:hypothetical protein [Thermoleophilaceae bacterium]